MSDKHVRAERSSDTRELILLTAEQLFAVYGVHAVSNRHIGEAAGQGNTAVVGYHFGTKADLVRAIMRKHADMLEHIHATMLRDIAGSTEVRDWVACLVRPTTEHLAALGSPTWFGRFNAQVMTDPALREILTQDSLAKPSMVETFDGLNRCLPEMPVEVHLERGDMARQLIVHMVAERERALAEGTSTPRENWRDAASGLIEAITGMFLAPLPAQQ